MNWHEAMYIIQAHIRPGTNLNTAGSNYRIVRSTEALINSNRYGYKNDRGFIVPIGKSATVSIPWQLLEHCFMALTSSGGFGGSFFREHYPLQAKDHYCHFHVIGQIFVVSGLARFDNGRYTLKK